MFFEERREREKEDSVHRAVVQTRSELEEPLAVDVSQLLPMGYHGNESESTRFSQEKKALEDQADDRKKQISKEEQERLQSELQELRAKLEKKLETEKSQKEMVEAKLLETGQALENCHKQLAQKGWEAADALAAANDEMARQRSESDERQRRLEEEAVLLRRKVEDLLAAQNSKVVDSVDSTLRQKVGSLEVQLQSKIRELEEQSAYVKQLEDSARLSATEAAQQAAQQAAKVGLVGTVAPPSEEEQEKIAELRSKLWAREDELVSVRSELEAFKKDASLEESRHLKQTAKQQKLEEERDELKVKLEHCQSRLLAADAESLAIESDAGEEQLLAVRQEKQQFHHQLQGVAQDLTQTLRDLETKAVADDCPQQLGETKRALTHLQEQIALVCDELLVERPTSRTKKAGQQKSRGSAEHATAAFKVLSAEHEELQSKHEQLQHGQT
eukprot:Skav216378  [mRNA]  locus=scaffold3826:39767:44959:+ [translate_table: standard]